MFTRIMHRASLARQTVVGSARRISKIQLSHRDFTSPSSVTPASFSTNSASTVETDLSNIKKQAEGASEQVTNLQASEVVIPSAEKQKESSNANGTEPEALFPPELEEQREWVEMWNKEAPAGPEWGGPREYEPTRYGDWARNGRVSDF